MIDYIKGQIVELTPTELVLDNHGTGYSILISLQTYEAFQGKAETVAYITISAKTKNCTSDSPPRTSGSCSGC